MSATTETQAPYDPWQSAANPTVRNRHVFGHCAAESWPCVLRKGSRPIRFDPDQHSVDERRTRIEISIQPLSGGRFNDPINRDMLVESNEWTKVCLPSIRALGIEPQNIRGQYVQVELVPTRDYIKADGNPGQATTPKFVAIFPDEASCRAAQEGHYGRGAGTVEGDALSPTTPNGNGAPAGTPAGGMTTAAQDTLLRALWDASNHSTGQLAILLNATPQFKHLTLDSPQVKAVTGEF